MPIMIKSGSITDPTGRDPTHAMTQEAEKKPLLRWAESIHDLVWLEKTFNDLAIVNLSRIYFTQWLSKVSPRLEGCLARPSTHTRAKKMLLKTIQIQSVIQSRGIIVFTKKRISPRR